MNYYFDVLKKYARFSGRACRKEYWYFTIINIIIGFLIGFFSGLFRVDNTLIVQIFSLAILLPSITVGARRVHDVGKNGWYILVPVYNIILFCTDSVRGDNAYGSNPKGISFPSDDTAEISEVPKNKNELIQFFEKNRTLFTSKGSIFFYSIIFIISLLLTLIIPFMYITLRQPMPVRPDSVSVINLFILINIVYLIIFIIPFLILKFIDFNNNGYKFISELKSYESLSQDDQIYLLDRSIKTYYSLKNAMLIILFIPFWSSLIASFVHVTGPLVLSHKVYYLNTIFLILYLIFIIAFFPTPGRAVEYYKNSIKED